MVLWEDVVDTRWYGRVLTVVVPGCSNGVEAGLCGRLVDGKVGVEEVNEMLGRVCVRWIREAKGFELKSGVSERAGVSSPTVREQDELVERLEGRG